MTAIARMTDEEFERDGWWNDDTTSPLLEEALRARGREGALEKALLEIAHSKAAKDGYLDNCPGCIARRALDGNGSPS